MDNNDIQLFGKLDDFTKRHSIAVSVLVSRVANSYGYPSEKLNLLSNAALMHDIGKIFTPIDILHKNAKLLESEFKVIKLHTQHGAELLEKHSYEKEYVNVALSHHEKLDGSGYPLGLKKGEILFEAQVVGVCDVYEALSAERPYKSAKPYKEVKQILLEDVEAGKFDRDIVNKVLEAGKALKKEEVMSSYSSLKYISKISPDVACDICDMNLKHGRILSPSEFKNMYKELGGMKEQGLDSPDFTTVENIVRGLSSAKRELDHQKSFSSGLGLKPHDIEL